MCNGASLPPGPEHRTRAPARIPTVVTGLSRGQIMDERLSWFHEQGIFDVAEIEEKLRLGREVYHRPRARSTPPR